MFTLTRICPQCQRTLTHTGKTLRNLKSNYSKAVKNNTICNSCNKKNLHKSNPEFIKNLRQCYINKHGNVGTFLGKTLSQEHKDKISKKMKYNWTHLTLEEKELCKVKFRNMGSDNGMYGRTVYDIWKHKYDEATVTEKTLQMSEKKSAKLSGSLNPQYNKPTPNGSGNGWKGYYMGKFFRSLRELCFMIYHTTNNIVFSSAENISIPYTINNVARTYRPDFIIDNVIFEIKPQKLIDGSLLVKTKADAAIKYCDNNNLTYIITDWNIDYNQIKKELDNGNIEFLEKYKDKFSTYSVPPIQ